MQWLSGCDQGIPSSRFTEGTMLYACIVMVQPGKTGNCPDMTEKLVIATQTSNKHTLEYFIGCAHF